MNDENSTPGEKSEPSQKIAAGEPGKRKNENSSLFPVVAIGASAGGLEALTALFAKMPLDTGIAFVIVTHQHPGHSSLLPELLGRVTALPVSEAVHDTKIAADHIYVAPPGANIRLIDGRFLVSEWDRTKSPPLQIDHFFRSLARDRKERSIGIVLSGTGTDGTLGLKEIKAEGGMVMVQSPNSAGYSGMPASALATGLVDFTLTPAEMPPALVAFITGPHLKRGAERDLGGALPSKALQEILAALRRRAGHDFTHYKPSTIIRRIFRRMSIHQLAEPAQYVRYAQENPRELDLLFRELLINVTSFFRDAAAWDSLAGGPLPEMLASFPAGHVIRAWAPGCTSGEESYSIAIVLRECMETISRAFEAQIFGTDLHAESIEAARIGQYPESIAADVSPARLSRWFTRNDKGYRVRSEIREMVVFAQHNVIADPPFTRLDLLSCRNLLIYLDSDLQKYLLPLFHYALRPGGLLFLGSAETIGEFDELFKAVDPKWKIFRALDVPTPRLAEDKKGFHFPRRHAAGLGAPSGRRRPDPGSLARQIDRMMLGRFCPTSVIVNEKGDIMHIYGRTGLYLEPSQGEARMNLLEMARDRLPLVLKAALRDVQTQSRAVSRRARFTSNGKQLRVDLGVLPIAEPEALRGLFLVTFSEAPPSGRKKTPHSIPPGEDVHDDRIAELERELQEGRESHQSITEEFEIANEELQSTNEELQSTNEELETSKEELQSLNEELTTVNTELQSKVEQLSQAYSDMQNLLENTKVATVFLDMDLNILRFTAEACALIRLAPGDCGRPLSDLVAKFNYPNVESDCREVLRTLQTREIEVHADNESDFLMRIGPYRTTHNVISGVVLTFERTGEMRAHFESIVQTVRHPLLVLDAELRVVTANRAFRHAFHLPPGSVGRPLFEIENAVWLNPNLRRLLAEIVPGDTVFEDFELEFDDPESGRHRVYMLNARPLRRPGRKTAMILMACEEVIRKRRNRTNRP